MFQNVFDDLVAGLLLMGAMFGVILCGVAYGLIKLAQHLSIVWK